MISRYIINHIINRPIISNNFLFKVLRFKRINYAYKKDPKHIFNKFDTTSSYFLHIPKTAGTSLKQAIYGSDSIQQSLHFTWLDYRLLLGKKKSINYFSFSCVRNPWDRCLSAYIFLQNGGYNNSDKKCYEKHIAKFDNFKDFIMHGLNNKNILSLTHFKPQTHFIYSKKNKCMVDHIIRFENIDLDYKLIKKKLNGKKLLKYKVYRTNDSYKNYYDENMIKVVRTVYHRDIELLGYNF